MRQFVQKIRNRIVCTKTSKKNTNGTYTATSKLEDVTNQCLGCTYEYLKNGMENNSMKAVFFNDDNMCLCVLPVDLLKAIEEVQKQLEDEK